MRIISYRDLAPGQFAKSVEKISAALARGDFAAAGLKKLSPTPYWRAKLNDQARLLMQFAPHRGETVCLFLEVIPNHAYEKSRFLRGAAIDRSKIESGPDDAAPQPEPSARGGLELRWLPAQAAEFELLDRPLIFDDAQEAVRRHKVPLVVVGSAGSGKTAVTLAKMREATGRVLYVTLSAYLAQTARRLYSAHGYENPAQDVEFMSFRELVDSIAVPEGVEVSFATFRAWLDRRRGGLKGELRQADAHAVFEEFRGVLSAPAAGPLSGADYQALGVRQSLFAAGEMRAAVHELFQKYVAWLKDAKLFDLNIVSHGWRAKTEALYDFVVVDEVQDFTSAQLALIFDSLKTKDRFLLCGDAHQIVHPNFFSWASVRALFREAPRDETAEAAAARDVSVLQANFRNTRAVTALANRLLKIKQARFGSVDRESNFLVKCASPAAGEVRLLKAEEKALKALDASSRASVRSAVIVLRDEDKAAARAHFRTPLVFSVHEAKGLEYPNVILFNLVSGNRAVYADLCRDVVAADLEADELDYRRAKDKADKSLELNKFYVNALYVAMTRAMEGLAVVESDVRHPLLGLLGLEEVAEIATGPVQASTKDEWAQEARKLELQGKQEQARSIRQTFLASRPTPWTPWSLTALGEWAPRRSIPETLPRRSSKTCSITRCGMDKAPISRSSPGKPSSPPRFRSLMKGTCWGVSKGRCTDGDSSIPPRTMASPTIPKTRWGAPPARLRRCASGCCGPTLSARRKPYCKTAVSTASTIRTYCGATPLMLAARAGNVALVEQLLDRGADEDLVDDYGHTAWMGALNRAIDDHAFGKAHLGALFERLGPDTLDVHADGRLVRLERGQGEFWLLGLMLAGLKTHAGGLFARPLGPQRHMRGFFSDSLLRTLELLPEHLWSKSRRKRDYVSGVLARAEVGSAYRPARKLWKRRETGYYAPAPDLKLRRKTADGETWTSIAEAMSLAAVADGAGGWFFDVYGLDAAAATGSQAEATGSAWF